MDKPFELGYEVSTTTFTAQTPGEPTDWRDAADIYKQWALQQPWCAVPYAQRTDIPDWMKSGPSMIRFHRDWLGRPERVESWLNDYWKKHFPGVPLIVALWGWERVGSWVSPKYFPPYPSEAGFLAHGDRGPTGRRPCLSVALGLLLERRVPEELGRDIRVAGLGRL